MPISYKDLLLKEVKELFKKLPPNVRIRVYYDDMGKSKYTLNQLGSRIDQIGDALFEFIKTTNTRLDNLTNDVNSLKQDVKGLKQEVKDINARLDYIVQANDLRDLPKSR